MVSKVTKIRFQGILGCECVSLWVYGKKCSKIEISRPKWGLDNLVLVSLEMDLFVDQNIFLHLLTSKKNLYMAFFMRQFP